jgi:hypothetical protein
LNAHLEQSSSLLRATFDIVRSFLALALDVFPPQEELE